MSEEKTYPQLEVMPLAELTPAGYNPRKITDAARARLAKSYDELGNIQPLVYNVRTKTLVGGHQRLKVLLAKGHTTTPVWCVDLPLEKEKAANLALNNFAGDWDDAALTALLGELDETDLDLEITGFDAAELDDLLNEEPEKTLIHTITFQFNESEWKKVRRLTPAQRSEVRKSILAMAKCVRRKKAEAVTNG